VTARGTTLWTEKPAGASNQAQRQSKGRREGAQEAVTRLYGDKFFEIAQQF
jgi:hypothetical protein